VRGAFGFVAKRRSRFDPGARCGGIPITLSQV
jgi:hypothetical protein